VYTPEKLNSTRIAPMSSLAMSSGQGIVIITPHHNFNKAMINNSKYKNNCYSNHIVTNTIKVKLKAQP